MAQRIAENTWRIQGRTVTLPVVIRNSLVAAAVFVLVKQVNRIKSAVETPRPTDAPTTRECPFCMSTISKRATRCPSCTSQVTAA